MKKFFVLLLSFCLLATTAASCKKAPVAEGQENPGAAPTGENIVTTEAPTTMPETIDDGLESVWIVTERNVNGRLFEVSYDENYMVKSESAENRRYDFTTNAAGLITELKGYASTHYTMTYDESGLMTGSKIYDDEGTVKYENHYTYNEQGQLTQSLRYFFNTGNNKKSVDFRIVNEYNEAGQLLYRYYYRSEDDSRLKTKFTYSYNDAGQCDRCEEYDVGDDYTFTYIYEYDRYGILKKKTATNDYDSDWDYECTWNVTVDEQGLITKVYASLHGSYRNYSYQEIRVDPQHAETIRKNQAQFLSQDILQAMKREIEMPLEQ